MIFVSVGTQKFQFNRLLQYIDELIDEGVIKEEVFAQIGYSTYTPKNYRFTNFLNEEDFGKRIMMCDIYITHGGVGSINQGLHLGKKIIACPRLHKFNEHIDDHQIELVDKFFESKYLLKALNIDELKMAINIAGAFHPSFSIKKTNNKVIVEISKIIQGEK
jgi:UDP-N-acetylglucosamine transferase subunit ALG13